jgi:DNA-binding PadR family transcriptional regulator
MRLKYQENLFEIIATVIGDRRIHHNEILRRCQTTLGYTISHNKILNRLSNMIDDGLLTKDGTGKRGTREFYSLTDKGKRMHHLKIIGTDPNVQRLISLYQLLIFFEVFKRGALLSKSQLNIFLRKIGSSINKLEKLQDNNFSTSPNIINFKPIDNVEIIAITQNHYTKFSRTYYYVVTPGLSVKEFVRYVKLLKFGNEPRPFTSYPAILQIPFISYMSFTRKEVLSAVKTLEKYGLLESRTILGEKRFVIKDENLRRLIGKIWYVNILDVHLLHMKLIHKRPTDKDKEYLRSFVNEKVANKLRIHANDIRVSNKQKKQVQKDVSKSIAFLENNRYNIIKSKKNIKRFLRKMR